MLGVVLVERVTAIPTDTIYGHPSYGMPYYFSGTNSRVSMIVGNTYDGLQRVEFRVGGLLVWAEDYPSPWALPFIGTLSATRSVMFDSTRFQSGSSLEVEVRVWGWGPSYRSFSETAPVINQAVLYGRYDQEIAYLSKDSSGNWVMASDGDETPYQALPSSSSRLPSMGYDIYAENKSLGWTALELGADFENGNVFHVHSHGNADLIWSDTNDYWYDYVSNPGPIKNIYGSSLPSSCPSGSIGLLAHRMTSNGDQYPLPPYNSTGKPPINLAVIAACDAGVTNVFAEGTLWPYGNVYTGVSQYPENQSCVGSAISFKSNQNHAVSEAFWEHLKDTYTVTEARYLAFNAYDGSNKPATALEFMHVWGDYHTRLKGVYTGGTGAAPGWYR